MKGDGVGGSDWRVLDAKRRRDRLTGLFHDLS